MSGFRDFLVRAAVVAALLVPVWFAAGALGTKFGLLDWRVGFGLMTLKLGLPILLGTAALGVLALLAALIVAPRRGRIAALLALLVPVAALGYAANVQRTAKALPPIHDISTDLADPPAFSETVVKARAAVPGGNSLERKADLADQQKGAYPDLKSYVTDAPAADAFQVVLDTAQAQRGWTIGKVDAAAGVIEASTSSFWYGFTDDIVIRVRDLPDGSGSAVDMRSVSRVGISDLGANARRIRGFLDDLNTRMGEAATGG